MERSALVTGSPGRVGDVAIALKEVGFDVTEAGGGERLAEVAGGLGSGSVDTYVQLPWDAETSAVSAIEQVHEFLTGGLLARFRMARDMLPLLRPGASVVLVAGHRPALAQTPDDRHARKSLLRVLARTIEADTADAGVSTVVVGDQCSSAQIAEIALHRGPDQRRRLSEYAGHRDELSFADWQREILALSTAWWE
ncbi:MAG: hypothetical protein ACRDQ2_03610 [Gaiellales bacterium]